MKLSPSKSSYNFYESFSDLLFCTLVLFVVLVLALALNVNQKVKDYQERLKRQIPEEAAKLAAAQAEARTAKLQAEVYAATDRAEAAERRAVEAERARAAAERQAREAAAQTAQAEKTAREAAAGAAAAKERAERAEASLLATRARPEAPEPEHFLPNQFCGQSANPKMNLAFVDPRASGRDVHVCPVPANIAHGITTSVIGETDEQKHRRIAGHLEELQRIAREVAPLNARQFTALLTSFSTVGRFAASDDPQTRVGFDCDPGSARVNLVYPGSPAALGGLKVGDVVVEFNGQPFRPSAALAQFREFQRASPGAANIAYAVRRDGRPQTLTGPLFPFRVDAFQWVCNGITTAVVSRLLTPQREVAPGTTANQLETALARLNSDGYSEILAREARAAGGTAQSPAPTFGYSELPFALAAGNQVVIGGEKFTPQQFELVLRSLEGAVSIRFVPSQDYARLPVTFVRRRLLPTGFINRTPDLDLAVGNLLDPAAPGGKPATGK